MSNYHDRMKRGEKFVKTMDREGLLTYQKKTYPELYDLTVGHLFGDIWTRPHLSVRDRQLITLAANIALARTTGNHSHYNSAMHIGITKEQIIELIIHVGHYAGWPTMGLAIRQFNKVLKVNASERKKRIPKEERHWRRRGKEMPEPLGYPARHERDAKCAESQGGFMLIPRLVAWTASFGAMVLGGGGVCAQDYPNKSVRIVTAQPGGGSDFMSRLIAQGLSGPLGQQVIVENRGGASGAIASEIVAKAPPDGHTLLLYASTVWIVPLMQVVPYDPVRDFSPITMAVRSPIILVVHPSLPVRSVKELIALAKARPGELNYASSSTGSPNHLAAELFKAMAGVNIVHVPYKGGGPALNDLIGGHVQLMFATAGGAAPHVKSGRLRALAVTSAQPSALAPGLPTVAASGLPGYESATIIGVFVPAKTPATIVNRLNQEIVRVLNRTEVKERLFNAGAEVVGSSPEQLAVYMKFDMARMGKVIKDAGIRAD